MTTRLGKILVLLTTALSWSLAVWVYGAYTQAIDWGWKEPRKDIEKKRVPSELDKRKQQVEAARASAERAQAALHQARTNLHLAQIQYPANHLQYNNILNTLASAPGKITVPEIVPGPLGPLAMPTFDQKPIQGLNRSEQGLLAELRDLQAQIDVQVTALKALDKEQKAITQRLSPLKGANDQVVRKGLDDLAEVEAQTQFRLREEMARLRPTWTRELANAQLLIDRRESLRRRLDELRQKNKVAAAR
jgi:hypothetical protein